jgi:ABC-type nickel/cobalt efflux system permease component RcnA
MHPPTPNPTETSHEREALLWQEARNSRVTQWGRAITRVALVCSVAIFAVVLFVRLGGTIGWVGTYFFPMGVILGMVVAVLALLMWALDRLPSSPYRDRWQ